MSVKRWTVFHAARYEDGYLREIIDKANCSDGRPVMVDSEAYDALKRERDEAVALLREHRSHGAVQTVDDLFVLLNRIDAFLAKAKQQ